MTQEQIQHTFGIAAQLLAYPYEHFHERYMHLADDISQIKNRTVSGYFHLFVYETRDMERQELQDLYVESFGLGKETSLYLTHSMRFRKAALRELREDYEKAGWTLNIQPDYLPILLVLASTVSYATGLNILKRHRLRLLNIMKGLEGANSPYLFVLRAVVKTLHESLKQDSSKVITFPPSYQKRT